jgi:transposase
LNHEQFLDIYNAGPEAVYKLLSAIMETNIRLSVQVSIQEERIKELESRLNKSSRNSNKPPSSDEFVKPKSQRKKTGKKSGGQKGHKGHTLKMTDTPDNIVTHRIKICQGCGHPLEDVALKEIEKRQVYDIPPLQMIVTEHQAEKVICPCCDLENKAFPEGVDQPVQYGNNLKSLLVYLNQYQMIPYKRAVQLIEDVYGFCLSEATVFNSICAAFNALEPVERKIIDQIIGSPVVHVDETGMRIEAKRQWLHVISTETLTHYGCHLKRGNAATDAIGVLPKVTGKAVHDYWKPYYKYDIGHFLCNAHHLRELTGIFELTGQQWPLEMIDLLLEIKVLVDGRRAIADRLNPEEIKSCEQRYSQIINKGYLENPPPAESKTKRRGRKKQSKARNLLDRLSGHRLEALGFMYDFKVPFDNNLAERDIRMMKVKQKISGVFRSNHGAKMFCRIRGYISTARKNSIPILNTIKAALDGNPFVPEF